MSDVFVFLDNVQFSKNSFINRNRIKMQNEVKWLTVPVETSGKSQQLIKDTKIAEKYDWRKNHLHTLENTYRKAPFFSEIMELVLPTYNLKTNYLSEFNIELIKNICHYLNTSIKFQIASQLNVSGSATDLLLKICQALSGNTYIHGMGGTDYQDQELFHNAGIKLQLCKYDNPEYPQLGDKFEPSLSIIDMLFNVGTKAKGIIKSEMNK
jgi:hypothetical protein